MKSGDIFKAFNDIDNKHINTSCEQAKWGLKYRAIQKWISVAACIGLVGTMGLGIYVYTGSERSGVPFSEDLQGDITTTTTNPVENDSVNMIVYPEENTPCNMESPPQGLGDYSKQMVYSYAELAKRSDFVIVADVADTYREPSNINTFLLYAKVNVVEVLKGETSKGEILYVKDNGVGRQDEDGNFLGAYTRCGGPLLEKGNRVVLFLSRELRMVETKDGIKLWNFIDYELGKFFYDRDGKYHASALYADSFSESYNRPYILEDYAPKTLDEIKNLIAE